tara:strand:+ start:1132 stop:2397 length:1266 start_codon:yes stop_codon:yes gene_type:complete
MASNANIFIKAKYDGKEADSGLDRLNQKLKQNALRLQNAQQIAKRFNAQLDRTQVRFRTQALTASKVLKTQNEIMREQQMKMKQLGNAALGVGLSMLFLGMQIKALSQRTLQSIFKTFSEVTQGTMAYNQTVGRVSAAFEFLKFSIADAFMTSALGQALLETLISIFDFISGVSDETKIFLVIVLLLGVAFGALAMVLGQLIIPLKVAIDSGFTLKAIALGIGAVLFSIVIILTAIYALVQIWNSDMSIIKKIGLSMIIIFAAILAILFMFGVTLTAPVIILTLLIALAVSLGLALILAGDEFKLAFFKAILAIGQKIKEVIIGGISAAIRLANKIPGVNIKTPSFESFMDLSGLQSKVTTLESSIAQRKAEREAKKSEDNSITTTSSNIFIDTFKAGAEDVKGSLDEALDLDQYNTLSGE